MKTVLIADDEPITRMDLADMLTELGFTVAGQAADGFDAVEFCRSHTPDVVLMDVKMPIFDGLSAAETILAEGLAGCVVLLTAFSDRDLIDRAAQAGVTGYLVKPIRQQDLLPAIEVAMAQSTRLRKSRQETQAAQEKLRQDRQIHKAQQVLARQQGCSESEAYRRLRKTAMDKRTTIAALAEGILRQAAQTDRVAQAKAFLRKHKGLSDESAYRYLAAQAQRTGGTVEEAAQALLAAFRKEVSP